MGYISWTSDFVWIKLGGRNENQMVSKIKTMILLIGIKTEFNSNYKKNTIF